MELKNLDAHKEEAKMDKGHYTLLMTELVWFKEKLDKIIELLEFSKGHHHIQMIPASQPYIRQDGKLIPAVEDNTLLCNCGDHKYGELTGGWHCPVHGQCF